MGRWPEQGSGPGGGAGQDPGLPGNAQAGFAPGGEWDACPPSAALATAVQGASGEEWRCPGATHEELIGLLRQWAALESWASAGKLGVLRALMREEDLPVDGGHHGDLPDGWSKSLTREVALALAMSAQSTEVMMWLAWDLQARLPGIGRLLADGTLNYGKAKAVDEELRLLTDPEIERAEQLVLDGLAVDGSPKSFAQLLKIAERAAITVNPEIATLRRKDAEETKARVTKSRERSGAAALSGRDLPIDETLAADGRVTARAEEYKAAKAFGDIGMDRLRAMAYLDLLNGVQAGERIARAGSDGEGQGSDGEGPGSDGGGGPRDPVPPPSPTILPRLADLVIPLVTLLGLTERPGEGHGLGPLDPDVCRDLAVAAAGSAQSEWCVTVSDPDGIAIGHGCACRARSAGTLPGSGALRGSRALPARVNLTVTSTQLARLTGTSVPPGARAPAACTFTPRDDPGPPCGYGAWTLTLPGGRDLVVQLEPVPTFECDHRRESHAYQPNSKLRHLVQVRDYECTFPTCSRHARDSDFEHAVPYDKGGRTCCCNAGARSRACHQVKQSPGWDVTQPRPGWHQWQTPGGRIYTQGPKRYPV